MGLKHLWTPWRGAFVLSKKPRNGCVFCDLPKEEDGPKNLILFRGKTNFVILNKYPYNNGHLMIVPNQHTADMLTLQQEEMFEMLSLTRKSVEALKEGYNPEGFNIGMNMGAAAGAGIREHLHMHVVPRWTGDTNFLPLLSQTKAMPQTLIDSFEMLKPIFRRLK